MEASRLPSLGLPLGSFTLVIDGEPISAGSTKVLNILHCDAAWQLAYEESINNKDLWPTPPEWLQLRRNAAFVMQGFPEALRDVSDGISPVKCNFPTGHAQPVDQVVTQGSAWSLTEWTNNWLAMGQTAVDTEVHFPTWLETRFEDILSE
jgi:hypothetical protein